MFLVKLLKIAKPITSLAASYSTGVVVKNVVMATTPRDLGKYQKLAVQAGGFFIGGAVGGVIAERIDNQFDNVIKAVEGVAEIDPISKFNQFVDTLTPEETATLKAALGFEDEKEEN